MDEESVDMAFTGRPNVTDIERQRMKKASGPKQLMLMALMQILKLPDLPEIKKGTTTPAKADTNFDKWQKKNRGL